jgi:ABC-type polysaccharide transport system permease subunit
LRAKQKDGIKLFFLALPFIALVVAFSFVPLFGWSYAFVDYRIGKNLADMAFVGFKHFGKLITEWKTITMVLRNTFAMSLLSIATSPLPMIFAIMLNEIKTKKIKGFVQTLTTLPNFISWIVVFGITFSLFSNSGGVSRLVAALGGSLGPAGVLGNKDITWFFQLALQIWKNLGWGAIIYLAAIAGIDSEMYEAAQIDGANKVQAIRHITVPSILPTYFVLLLLSIGSILSNGFEQFFVFYNSLVSDRIEVLDYYVYKIGMVAGDYSYSIVVGMLKSLVSVTLLFIANQVSKKIRNESLI